MRSIIIVLTALMLVLAGCNSSSPVQTATEAPTPPTLPISATPSQAPSPRSGSGSLFAIEEVGVGPAGYVALTNFTDQPASLGGLFLCQGAKCFALPDVAVAPKATVRVASGDGAGLDGVVATGATIGELRPSDGEVALYASPTVKDPKAMLVYLEWGSTPHDNTQAAIDAGLWINGSFAPTSNNATRLFRNEGGLWLFDAE
jgi:hypothetical protein